MQTASELGDARSGVYDNSRGTMSSGGYAEVDGMVGMNPYNQAGYLIVVNSLFVFFTIVFVGLFKVIARLYGCTSTNVSFRQL